MTDTDRLTLSEDNWRSQKGGTVVPPSDFQSESTYPTKGQTFAGESLADTRSRSRARAIVTPSDINVLIACEESQAECKAFCEMGFNAFSCDIQRCRPKGDETRHIVADVTPLLQGQTTFTTQDGIEHNVTRWHMIIAHPPCTYLCKVGSMHLYENPSIYREINGEYKHINADRWEKMLSARQFFFTCLNAKTNFLAVENPIPMKIARLPPPTTYACPSWFGVKYTKKTLYWLKNLPPLLPTIFFPNAKSFVGASRGKYRSRTFPQLAHAIASQWGEYVLNQLKKNVSLINEK